MTKTTEKQSELRADRKYEYMPASTDTAIKGYNLGIRYERNKKYEIQRIQNGFMFRLNDRTLYLMRSFEPSEKRLYGMDLDEVISLDLLLNKEVLGQMGYNYAMVNAAEISNKYTYDDYDAEQTNLWPHIVADSGGFQLATGAQSYLNPEDIIEKHNRICDIGIILDIPLPHNYQEFLLGRAAQVQKLNTEILLASKRKSLDLMNVIHGSTFYLRRKFRDVVETDKCSRVALGGVKTLDLVPLVLHVLMLVQEGKEYEQVHVLGVSGLERWVALSYLARRCRGKLITSDSSSYIQGGINLQYYDPAQLLGIFDLREVTSTGIEGKFVRKAMPLPCSCIVCSMVRQSKVITDKRNSLNFTAVIGHNLATARSYIDEIWALTADDAPTVIRFLKPFFKLSKLDKLNQALKSIDYALEHGVDKAAAKFAPFLLNKFPKDHRRGLFRSDGTDTDVFKRFDKVISTYEKKHGISKSKK